MSLRHPFFSALALIFSIALRNTLIALGFEVSIKAVICSISLQGMLLGSSRRTSSKWNTQVLSGSRSLPFSKHL